ncbi:potassium uptake protein, TrkH family [Candidatus Vecturithrix granuli]|uniref:Potassium uptake protein, TrkH family n=1 Tax=Vecturithrix granuli TaxID=1499967 RepID=A0A081C5F0_VECG1|nr:potassium uptake protein, TrkH family [Candidatus Vecturithrix granuli]
MATNTVPWNRYEHELHFLYILRWIMGFTALIAFLLLAIDYGVYLDSQSLAWVETGQVIVGYLFLGGYVVQLIIRRDRWKYLRHNKFKYAVSLGMLLEIAIVYGFQIDLRVVRLLQDLDSITFRHPQILLFQLYIFSNVLRWVVKISQSLAQYNVSPAHFILISFGSAILLGAALLLLPKATTASIHPIDALFTATSAVCVTGLIVVDTATAFTKLGQIFILLLIQFGGLGIMTVTAFFSLLIGQRMTGREQLLLGDMLDTRQVAQLGALLRTIFFTAISIEACGIGLLYLSWKEYLPADASLYTAFFHAISAFCNAGFSTFPDSLMGFATNMKINFTVTGLIILGGLGVGTLRNMGHACVNALKEKRTTSLSVQSKLVLLMTALLLIIGMSLFFMLEYTNTLAEYPWQSQALIAFFQAVTFRTAGFNTVDFGKVKESTLMVGIVLMFIGAGPGSTAGGIKVTTLAILLATVVSAARGQTRLELFHRTIPTMVLHQTLVVVTLYLSLMMSVSLLLSLTEPRFRLIELLFETVSALGTVGLSTGVTPHLSVAGKIFIIITMFAGRVGPFTLALAIGQRQRTERYRYPEEKVQIG